MFERRAVHVLIIPLLIAAVGSPSHAQMIGVSATVGGGSADVHWECRDFACNAMLPEGGRTVPFVQLALDFQHLVGASAEYTTWSKDEEHIAIWSLALSLRVPAGPVRVRVRGGIDHASLSYPPAQALSIGQTNSSWTGTGPMAGLSVDLPIARHIAVTPTASYHHPNIDAPDLGPVESGWTGTIWLIGVGLTIHN